MDVRPESSSPKLKGPETESPWIPTTPVKPGLTSLQPICKEKQEFQSIQANWVNLGRISQQSQASQGNCLESDVGSCNREAAMAAKSQVNGDAFSVYSKFSMEGADQWSKVSFKNLLALADAAGAATVAENAYTRTAFNAESRSSTPVSSTQIEYSKFQAISRNCSQANEGFFLESRLQNDSDTANRGTASSSQHFFDLNSAPRTVISATSSTGILSQFEPITPDQTTKRANKEKESAVQNLCMNEAAKETDRQSEVTTFELHEHQNEGRSELVDNQSCAPMSALSENHKPDIGSNQNTDLKTPQQKPRRRKHRPKVVIEGQPKRTSTSRTKKPTGPDGITRIKRKYVRKNRASEPGDTPLEGSTITPLQNVSPGSEEKPESKRKYVRRKVINEPKTTSLEEGTNGEAGSEEKPKSKRKYVRRNVINEPKTTSLEEGTNGAAYAKETRATRKSCRRSLNFDSEGHEVSEKSKYQPSSDLDAKSHAQVSDEPYQSRSTMNSGLGMDVIIEKMEAGIAYDLKRSMNHVLEDRLYIKENQAPHPSTSLKIDQLHDKLMTDYPNECTRGKCQIVFSDTTHDKEANIVETVNSDDQPATRSSSISNCGTSYLTRERQASGSKRKRFPTTDELDSCSMNATGAQCNSLQVYLKILPPNEHNEGVTGMHFPTIHKKKRTEKGSKSATSSMLATMATTDYCVRNGASRHNDPCEQAFTSESSFGFPATHCDPSSGLTKIATADGAQDEWQDFKCLLSVGSADRITKKRSKGPTRVRDLTSLLEICKPLSSSSTKGLPHSAPHTCMEALVADTHARLTTKKRSKRNVVGSSLNTYSHHQVLTKSTGLPAAIMWKNMSPIDAIVEQFNHLDIDAESNKFAYQEQNALVAFHQEYPWQNALVVYQSDGTMIPFDGSFEYTRKRRSRPKVDLDDETTRVWKLLLEDINNEGIDGTDEQKAEWWQGERKVFGGRAKTFIARMRLVQGDRHFTPWKGSVVDSVVGVFLTQNVSDHLSSSAFISMTARFPLKSHIHEPSHKKGTCEEPEVLDPDDTIEWHKKVSNQQTSDQESVTLRGIEFNGGQINHRIFFGIISEGIKSTENSKFISDSSDYGANIYDEAEVDRLDTQNNRTLASLEGDQRELDDVNFSQNSAVSPQNSGDSIAQANQKNESYSSSSSGADPTDGDCGSTFVKLLQLAGTTALHGVYNHSCTKRSPNMERPTKSEDTVCNSQRDQEPGDFDPLQNSRLPDNFKEHELSATEQSGLSEESAAAASSENIIALSFEEVQKFSGENCTSAGNHRMAAEDEETELDSEVQKQRKNQNTRQDLTSPMFSDRILDASVRTNSIDKTSSPGRNAGESNSSDSNNLVETDHGMNPSPSKAKRARKGKEKKDAVDWDSLRKQAMANGKRTGRTANTMDSVDWEAVRCAPVEEIAQTIKERGMNNMLAERIKDFLNRLVRDHGSIDLEWLRDVPPDKAKEYLLSVRGLGLKSVECVRLLTLHHLAFPVDTNVGRIAVRLGWVPLQPLPESLQLHLLELYPVLESIQKYLWPRLCKLDQGTLYELHYQMITFGKVFCTKSKPNCNSCPMRGECRHFASAFASARLALPAPEEKGIISATDSKADDRNSAENVNYLQLPQPPANQLLEAWPQVKNSEPIIEEPATPEPLIEAHATSEPIIEMPATPGPEETQVSVVDIEDSFPEDAEGIPTIDLNIEELNRNLQKIIQNNVELQGSAMSKALVVLTPEAASIPMPKLKNISRLRTEHRVYELPDTHQLLRGLDEREPDDPCPYLLAIWTPGETINSIQPPERRCSIQESGELCDEETCFSCNSVREARSQTVRGTLLIPCRTAMRGSFPLNGTYFQVNEVFADHKSSLNPIDVPREWLWNLKRRTVYFGTSIPTIFKGLQSLEIQYCFWRGFVCVRGFDRKTRAPRPLIARLHFPASRMTRTRGRTEES